MCGGAYRTVESPAVILANPAAQATKKGTGVKFRVIFEYNEEDAVHLADTAVWARATQEVDRQAGREVKVSYEKNRGYGWYPA